MGIGKLNNNFKDGKPKCFNYNKYGHMTKECETRKCFKCKKKEYIAKDCKRTQSMKKQQVQEESDNEDEKNEKDFGEDLK